MIKLLLVSTQYPPNIGGGGSLAYYLAVELARLGDVEVHVLTALLPNSPAEFQPSPNLFVHRVNMAASSRLEFGPAIHKGLHLCGKHQIDVVHGHHFPGAHIGLRLKTSFEIPLVVTLHKTPLLRRDRQLVRTDPVYSDMQFLAKSSLVDVFVAGSRAFLNELSMFDFAARTRRRLIYHGIPIKLLKGLAYEPRRTRGEIGLSVPDDAHLVVCPARIDDERKELDVLVRAAGIVKNELPKRRFVYVFTGFAGGASKPRAILEETARQHGVEGDLVFRGFSFEELPALYGLATACVLPSLREGLV